MRIFALFSLFFILSGCVYGQENGLVVRYDFSYKASPPMRPFYLRVYVNDILIDSTKPHFPYHNLANAVRIKLEKGYYNIKIEGVTISKDQNFILVMEWKRNLTIGKGKNRVVLKLNDRYQMESSTITE